MRHLRRRTHFDDKLLRLRQILVAALRLREFIVREKENLSRATSEKPLHFKPLLPRKPER